MDTLKNLTLNIIGEGALLMHADRLANPLDALGKEMKKISKKRTKTDEDHLEMARIEYVGGLYFDKLIGVYLPSHMLKASFVAGAKKVKKGPQAKSGIFFKESKNKLIHTGGDTIDELWADEQFRLTTSVVVSRARIMRTRPCFPAWSCIVQLMYDNTALDADEIVDFANRAGSICGLGDWRIEKGGDFGRYRVEVL